MLIETLSRSFQKARLVNQTSATFVPKVPVNLEPTITDPATATGQVTFNLSHIPTGVLAQNAIILVPYCTGNDDVTFSVRVIGWRIIGENNPQTQLWVPVNLIELACTGGTSTGVAGCVILSTERFADTITVTTGSSLSGEAPSENIVSPANDTIAHALIDLKGSQKFEITFSTGSSATDCNALWSLL